MKPMPFRKYGPPSAWEYPARTWPSKRHEAAPRWCSVDLRDGNQALETPMSVGQKLTFFHLLTEIGFREIEIGFPSASPSEYQLTRRLIRDGLIPDDVWIQVMTSAAPSIIDDTFRSLRGVSRVIVNLYNTASKEHAAIVYGEDADTFRAFTLRAVDRVAERAQAMPDTEIILEYTPEHFAAADPDEALSLCEAVTERWLAAGFEAIIVNLTATVERMSPNRYADRVEHFIRHFKYRDRVTVSIHTHNDRGTGTAASELGLLAGADRVEGTLFANGERSGNCDLITLALNLYAEGIDPKLNLEHADRLVEIYELCTKMDVPPRHPYMGELVFTAFSGTHQDAIRKGLKRYAHEEGPWNVPYLLIDPRDIGRHMAPLIRINSQSGKSGIAFVMEQSFGYQLPKVMQRVFAQTVTRASDEDKMELKPEAILERFIRQYQNLMTPFKILQWHEHMISDTTVSASAKIWQSPCGTDTEDVHVTDTGELRSYGVPGEMLEVSGIGHGMFEAILSGLNDALGLCMNTTLYHQHALEQRTASKVVTYVGVSEHGRTAYGVGVSGNFTKSSLRALMSAVNNLCCEMYHERADRDVESD